MQIVYANLKSQFPQNLNRKLIYRGISPPSPHPLSRFESWPDLSMLNASNARQTSNDPCSCLLLLFEGRDVCELCHRQHLRFLNYIIIKYMIYLTT